MKKTILVLLILVTTSSIKAVEPAVYVPPLPADLEAFTDNEELFFNKLMDFYIPAILLKNQLDLLNIKTNTKIPPLSYETISNMETKDIKKYQKIASDLYKKVKETDLNIVDQNLFLCEKEKNELKMQITKLSIDTIASRKNQEIYELLKASLDSSLQQNKEIEKNLWKKIDDLTDEFNEYKINSTYEGNKKPVFYMKTEINAEHYFFNDTRLNSKLSPGFGINVVLIKLTKNTSAINFWGKYNFLTTDVSAYSQKPQYVYNVLKNTTNVWSFGTDLQLSLGDLFNINKIDWFLNLGYGYFIGYSKYNNLSYQENDFSGYEIKIETTVGRFSSSFPFSLVFGTNFKKFTDELIFTDINNPVNLGKLWITSIYTGIQFDFVKLY